MKIITKLILSFLFLSLLIFAVGYYSANKSQEILQKTIGENSVTLAQETADKIDRYIFSRVDELRVYSKDLTLQEGIAKSNEEFGKLDNIQEYINEKDEEWTSASRETVTAFMQRLMDNELSEELGEKTEYYIDKNDHSVYGEIFVTNKYGGNIALTGKTTDYRQDDEEWWQNTKKDGIYVSDVGYDESAGIYSIDISVKVNDEGGNFLGVIIAILNIEEIINIIDELKDSSKYESENFELLTKEGSAIHETKEFEFLGIMPEEELRKYTSSEGYFIIQEEGEDETEIIAHAHSVGYKDFKGLGWIIIVEYEVDEIFAPVITLRNTLLFISLVSAIFAGLLGLLISRSISIPITNLKNKTLEIGSGKLDTVIEVKSKDEVGELAASFNRMTKDLREITASRNELNKEITERKHAEEENVELEQQLRQAQKMEAVGQLAGGIAHDFNNILTAIMGFGSLAKMKLKENDPLVTDLNHILSSADKAAYLTQSLLLFSRKQVLNLEPTNLNDLVKNSMKFLLRFIGADIELKTTFMENDAIIMADSVQIDQILMNLATNARDAMPDGGVLTIETENLELIEEFIRNQGYGIPGKYVLLSVGDTGTGMDKEIKEKIFEPFFTTKEAGKGTGLGLSVTYGIIKQHNGFINIYSEPGEGTILKIYLPITRINVEEAETEDISDLPKGTETILIAEDDEIVRNYMKTILEKFGYEIIESVDGEDAVNKFIENEDKIHLSILDMVMPMKDGKKAYDEINKIRPGIKTLFISGYTKNIIDQKMVFEEGMHFISKPVLPADLLNKVRELLDSYS